MNLLAKLRNHDKQAVGVVVNNSASYIEEVFQFLTSNIPVVPLRNNADKHRIDVAEVKRIVEPEASKPWLNVGFKQLTSNDIALVSFTSGTEGEPKGVALSHHNLFDTTQRLSEVMQIDSTVCEYIGIPVYLSFGFGRCRLISSIGGSAYIPPNGFNPHELAKLIDSDGINSISAVPSLIRVLLNNSELFKKNGIKIKWIEIGSQYMSADEKNSLKKLFPNAKIIQHYGLTEASRTTFLDISEADDLYLESVGTTVGDSKVRINDAGRIEIKGPHVALGYLQTDVGFCNDDGWFETSDLGEEKNSYLFFKGRADDVINVGGMKLAPETIERNLERFIDAPTELAISRRVDEDLGEGFLLVLKESPDLNLDEYYSALIKTLKQMGVNAANAIAIAVSDNLPKTDSGKIQRKTLEQNFKGIPIYKKESKESGAEVLSPDQEKVLVLCKEVFEIDGFSVEESFYDLGIGSLTFIKLISKIKFVFNKELSVNDVFKNPTVKKLTDLILKDQDGLVEDHAVDVIREGDNSCRPFFFVGSPVYASHLCKRLSGSRPMYALNIFGLEELYRNKLMTFTIHDIAKYFYDEVKALQKSGPYSLGAYCADENIAMEVARHIVNNGDEIDFFGFFDVASAFTEKQSVFKKVSVKFRTVGISYIFLFLKRKLLKLKERVINVYWKMKLNTPDKVDANDSVLGRDRLVVDRFWNAKQEYIALPLDVEVTAYRSEEWSKDSLEILEETVSSYEEIIIPGTHTGMFLDENSLNALVESLNQKLA